MTVNIKNIPAADGLSRRRFLELAAMAAGSATMNFPNLLQAGGVNGKLNVAFIGLGGQGCDRLKEISGGDTTVTALCDVDEKLLAAAKKLLPKNAPAPKTFVDYREVLQADIDAVVIATPDHWHAPIATAALNAGKHVFCEKPLAHTISETRDLRRLSRQLPQLITQLGNQGSASANLRRGIELIQAGAIGRVREVHVWVPKSRSFTAGQEHPAGEDPVPAGLHWDAWNGPAPFRAYKQGIYHPKGWRAWYDFGGGSIADWGCHGLNLPFRALKLDYPTVIETNIEGEFTTGYPKNVRIRYDFPARTEMPPVTVWWYDGGRRPAPGVLPKSVAEHFGDFPAGGVLLLGDKGFTLGEPHTGADYIQLAGEKKLSGILNHAATKQIKLSLPRSPGHLMEWVQACTGGPATFSDFETGGHLTEIVLSGLVALRSRQTLHWKGEAMRAENTPEAAKFIQAHYRTGWKI